MPDFRDILAVLALGIVGLSLWLEANGHPVPEWLKAPVGSISGVVLGYYFVDSAQKVAKLVQGKAAPTPPAPGSDKGA